MADKNKSLLGGSFDNFVVNQLLTRTNILSKDEYRSDSNMTSLNYTGKNSYIRLSSGVNIDVETSNKLFDNEEYVGDKLAKNFILQGGTLKFENNGFNLRGGFGETYTLGNTFGDKLSQSGLEDFGLRPMAGIESVQIKSIGRWGSLREANIVVKAFNRAQYSIIEMLYLRPGYTILLEWGHTPYFINNNGVIETNNNIDLIDFFKSGITRKSIYKEILKKQEESEGNYDAFIGPVANFTTTTNADGSYTFNIKAISWGAVIESLKINASGIVPGQLSVITSNIQTKKEESTSTKTLEVKEPSQNIPDTSSKLSLILSEFLKFKNVDNLNVGESIVIDMEKEPYTNLANIFDLDKYGHSINNPQRINNQKKAPFLNITGFTFFKIFTIINFKNKEAKVSTSGANIYIPLGGLLSLISKNSILRNEDDNIIDINFNVNENVCFSPKYHISVNPEVCLIKYSESDFRLFEQKLNPLDPKKIPFNEDLYTFKNDEIKNTGYTMNIMVNIDKVLEILRKHESLSSTNEVYLHGFLTELMNEISEALGGVNEFNVGIDESTNTLIIRDNQLLKPKNNKDISIINTTGLNASVRDINVTTQLTPKLTSMIAIGAQASGTSIGIDASALSEYNRGLTDRIFSRKNEDNKPSNNNEDEVAKQDRANRIFAKIQGSIENNPSYYDLYLAIRDTYINTIANVQASGNALNIYKDLLNERKASNIEGVTRGLRTIPFTFSIKMDGISGIKFGQVFNIENERLPKHWIDKDGLPELGFLVSKIDHEISNNIWLTNIGGQAMPYRRGKAIPESNGLSKEEQDILIDVQALKAYITGIQWIEKILNLEDTLAPSEDKALLWGIDIFEESGNPADSSSVKVLSKVVGARLQLIFGFKSIDQIKKSSPDATVFDRIESMASNNIINSVLQKNSDRGHKYERAWKVNGKEIEAKLQINNNLQFQMGKYKSNFEIELNYLIDNLTGEDSPQYYDFGFPPNLSKDIVDTYNRSYNITGDPNSVVVTRTERPNFGTQGNNIGGWDPYNIKINNK